MHLVYKNQCIILRANNTEIDLTGGNNALLFLHYDSYQRERKMEEIRPIYRKIGDVYWELIEMYMTKVLLKDLLIFKTKSVTRKFSTFVQYVCHLSLSLSLSLSFIFSNFNNSSPTCFHLIEFVFQVHLIRLQSN